MTPQQIKDNAPNGATYYIDHCSIQYYKADEHGMVFIWSDGSWHDLPMHISEAYALKPLQQDAHT